MKNLLAAAAVATLALAPIAAHAEPGGHGQGHKKGHDKGHQDYRHDNGGAWTPPGLAKKPGGMPPGQYKKHYRQGQKLPSSYVKPSNYVADPSAYRLRDAPAGYRWVQVDNQYYLAQTRTGLISEVVSALVR